MESSQNNAAPSNRPAPAEFSRLDDESLEEFIRLAVVNEIIETYAFVPIANSDSNRKVIEACSGKAKELRASGVARIFIPALIPKYEYFLDFKTEITFERLAAILVDEDESGAEMETDRNEPDATEEVTAARAEQSPADPSRGAFEPEADRRALALLVGIIALLIFYLLAHFEK